MQSPSTTHNHKMHVISFCNRNQAGYDYGMCWPFPSMKNALGDEES